MNSAVRSSIAVCFVLLGLSSNGFAAEPPVTAIAIDPAETLLLTGSQAGVQTYTWPDLKPRKPIATELKQIHDIVFSPDGKTLAIAGGTPGEEGTVELWSWPATDRLGSHSIHSDVIYRVVWSRDSKFLFTASHDAGVSQLNAASGKFVRDFSGHSQPVNSIGLIDEHKLLVSAGSDQSIRVWELSNGELVRSFNNHTAAVEGLAVRPADGENALPMIASIARDKTLRLWQPTIGRLVRFKRLPAEPLAFVWSPEGNSLLLALQGGNLIQVDPDTLEITSTKKTNLKRPISLAITKDGKTAVLGGQSGRLQVIPYRESK